jgi:hypothetical protein
MTPEKTVMELCAIRNFQSRISAQTSFAPLMKVPKEKVMAKTAMPLPFSNRAPMAQWRAGGR